jgi:hypothetical protein
MINKESIMGIAKRMAANNSYKLEELVYEYFGNVKPEDLLQEILSLSSKDGWYLSTLYPLVDKLKPKIFTVYILQQDETVVYVGKSIDLMSRLNIHAKEKEFNKVFVITLKDAATQALCENSLIFKYLPKYNKAVNIGEVTLDTFFEEEKLSLVDWMNYVDWFTRPNHHLYKRLYYFITPSGYLIYKSSKDELCFKRENSCVIFNKIADSVETYSKPSIETQLKQAADLVSNPQIFSKVTRGVYKFGKYFITDKGNWRVEGSTKWYKNVNVNMITKELIKDMVVSAAVSTDPVPLWFGKYKGKLYSEILEIDPSYCDWLRSKLSKAELGRII